MLLFSRAPSSSPSSPPPPPPLHQQLTHYSSNGEQLAKTPASARIDNSLVQKQGKRFLRGWGLGEVWKLAGFVVAKTCHLATELATHTIYGPRKKSWGLEMTIITSMMRDVGLHSHLADISFIRGLVSLSTLAPLPSSALVTPFSFRVKARELRGLLADFDSYELGGSNYDPFSPEGGLGSGREVGGEWVVDKALWEKWQKDWKASGKSEKGGERIVLYLHGGAYYVFSAATHRSITLQMSRQCDARVYAINYRLAPETRFPGPLHDAVSAYFRLTDELGVKPENILFAGDSAGGGLVLGTLMYLRDNGYPLPSGAILMSPWVDLTMSCDSWDSNAPFDIVPRPGLDDHLNPVYCYLGEEGVKKYLTHPYASPLFGNFQNLPPLLIQSGEAEVLRDEITLLAHKATLSGTIVRHEVFEDCVHVFQTFPFLEATKIAFDSQRDFVINLLPSLSTSPSGPPNRNPNLLNSELTTSESKVVQPNRQEIPLSNTSSEREDDDERVKHSPSDNPPRSVERTNSIGRSSHTEEDEGEARTPLDVESTSFSSLLEPNRSWQAEGNGPPNRPKGLFRSSTSTSPFLSSPSIKTWASPPTHRAKLPSISGGHASISQLPPTPPKTRSRSASHPEIVGLVRVFEAGRGEGYAVRTFRPQFVQTDG